MTGPGDAGYTGTETASAEAGPSSASTGELAARLSQDVASLVRGELELARRELSQKGKQAGTGIGAFGAAGVLALYAAGVLIAAVVLALALALDAWLAALIVAVVLLGAAGGLALFGKRQVAQAEPLSPERTAENVKRDVDAVKHPARARGAGGHRDGGVQ